MQALNGPQKQASASGNSHEMERVVDAIGARSKDRAPEKGVRKQILLDNFVQLIEAAMFHQEVKQAQDSVSMYERMARLHKVQEAVHAHQYGYIKFLEV